MKSIFLKRKFVFFSLFLILFLDGLSQSFIFPILTNALLQNPHTPWSVSLSLSKREIWYGLIVGIFFFCWMIGAVFLGNLSDGWGRKKGLMISMLGLLLGNFVTAMAFLFYLLPFILLGRIIIGFTAGSQAIAQATMVDLVPRSEQARYTGWILLAVTLGAIVGPLYGEWLSIPSMGNSFHNAMPFFGVAGLSLLSIVILGICYREEEKNIQAQASLLKELKFILKNDAMKPLLLSAMGFFGCWAIDYFYMGIFLVHHFEHQPHVVSIYMACYGFGAALSMMSVAGYLEKWLEPSQGALLGWSMVALSFLLTPWNPWLLLHDVMGIVVGMGVGIGFLFTMKLFSQQVDVHHQGLVMGVFNALWVGMMGISIFVTDALNYLNSALPFLCCFLFYCFGFFARKKRPLWPFFQT